MLLSTLSLLALVLNVYALAVEDLKVVVTSTDGVQQHSSSLTPGKVPAAPVDVGTTDTLKITFAVKDREGGQGVQPHQAFLRFYDENTGEEGIQPVRVTSTGKGKYDLIMSRPPPSLPPSGADPLRVSLILGSFVHPPAKYDLFDLSIPASQPGPVHPEEASFHPLPEIHHTFRPEHQAPPQFVSLVFTGVVLAPWFVLVGLWSNIPYKLPGFSSPSILSFLGTLAAFEGLLFWYWVDLKLGQVLTYGAILGAFTFATGNRALSYIAKQRLGEK